MKVLDAELVESAVELTLYIGVNDAMMKVFRAETKRGSFVDFMYNQYQEVQWFKELLTWPFPEEHPEVEHEMYNVLYGGSNDEGT